MSVTMCKLGLLASAIDEADVYIQLYNSNLAYTSATSELTTYC